jgi:hypothetical protein
VFQALLRGQRLPLEVLLVFIELADPVQCLPAQRRVGAQELFKIPTRVVPANRVHQAVHFRHVPTAYIVAVGQELPRIGRQKLLDKRLPPGLRKGERHLVLFPVHRPVVPPLHLPGPVPPGADRRLVYREQALG